MKQDREVISILDLGEGIKVIVVTGGPCGGKSTALARLKQMLEDRGWKVIIVPESATKLMMAGVLMTAGELGGVQFQELVLRDTLFQNKVMFGAAKHYRNQGRKVVVLCDRGLMDGKAYIDPSAFNTMIDRLGYSHQELCEASCHAVMHLRTAALGAEKYYTLANNAARKESLEDARVLDEKTLQAWAGHSHPRIISNEGADFEVKLRHLFAEICAVLGDPIPFEKEDKFLIEAFDQGDLPADLKWHQNYITQYYLTYSDPVEERRIRARADDFGGESYYYTTKRYVSPGVRIENERMITGGEYDELIKLRDPRMHNIQKRRISFFWRDQFFELDVFNSPRSYDHALMEAERTDRATQLHLPPFIRVVRNVTGENQYSNWEIARQGKFAGVAA